MQPLCSRGSEVAVRAANGGVEAARAAGEGGSGVVEDADGMLCCGVLSAKAQEVCCGVLCRAASWCNAVLSWGEWQFVIPGGRVQRSVAVAGCRVRKHPSGEQAGGQVGRQAGTGDLLSRRRVAATLHG